MSIRLRFALSYAAFLVAAGLIVLLGVYIVLRYVPNDPLPGPTLRSSDGMLPMNVESALVEMAGLILFGLAVVGIVGGWFISGVMLRPLERINKAARIAATGRLDHRIRLAGPSDEFKELADSFDHMLERLHDAFETQERFAANASHELRTPLTVTATLLEVAQANPAEQDYPTLLERLRLTNTRAIALTEALLRLSNANAIALNAEPVDLAEILEVAVDESAQEACDRRVRTELCLNPAPISGDRTLLEQLAANLVQNAIRHNHDQGFVTVTTMSDASGPVLRVENTGAPYTPEVAARLTEPFLRGGARIRKSSSGYGLGLALVERISSLHGGKVNIAPREGGGLRVEVFFPQSGAIGEPA